MKVRLPLGSVRYFGFSLEEAEKLTERFAQKRIPCGAILSKEAGSSIGSLFGLPGFPPIEEKEETDLPAERIILFSGFSSSALDALIRDLREASLGIGALKAVVTPHNCTWPFCDLITELAEERERFRERQEEKAAK